MKLKNHLLSALIILTILMTNCTNKKPEPVIPNATPEAKKLFDFLLEIKGSYTLAGQHDFINSGTRYNDSTLSITGKYPAIYGSDFSWCYEGVHPDKFQHCGPANITTPFDSIEFLETPLSDLRQNMVETIKKQHKKGQIITLMWHNCFPAEGECCQGESIWAMENRPSPETMKELLTEGTALNEAWKTEADKIAGYLKQLQEANIPVLWRPYHEMNGVWFWWCNQRGEYGFKKLWIMMYEYFTNHHKLNNLLWVWNTNAPRDIKGDEAFDYELFYPGDEYVDILAADVYRADYKQLHHDDLDAMAKGKPISLGEVGQLPEPSVLDTQPKWTWFMAWGYFISGIRNEKEDVVKLYQSERVLTLDEIERNEEGDYFIASIK